MENGSENQENNAAVCLRQVKDNIAQSISLNEKAATAVTLVAVSKTFTPQAIRPVLDAGQRVFGENRVQEAAQKWPLLRDEYADVKLHLIGPLQSNKTAMAVGLFDCIETVDREKLARALASELKKQQKTIELFVQVNTGAEPQKAGVLVSDLPAFISLCRDELGLLISGLMCIPPVNEEAQKHFLLLAELARQNGLTNLSMGMSADYQTAIGCGATHVRVGSAIFGYR